MASNDDTGFRYLVESASPIMQSLTDKTTGYEIGNQRITLSTLNLFRKISTPRGNFEFSNKQTYKQKEHKLRYRIYSGVMTVRVIQKVNITMV